MPQDVAELYASNMMSLATQARGVIRDLNPKVCRIECSLFTSLESPPCYFYDVLYVMLNL